MEARDGWRASAGESMVMELIVMEDARLDE